MPYIDDIDVSAKADDIDQYAKDHDRAQEDLTKLTCFRAESEVGNTTLQPLERRSLTKQRQMPEPTPVISADKMES